VVVERGMSYTLCKKGGGGCQGEREKCPGDHVRGRNMSRGNVRFPTIGLRCGVGNAQQ